jgi:hypothetical protein
VSRAAAARPAPGEPAIAAGSPATEAPAAAGPPGPIHPAEPPADAPAWDAPALDWLDHLLALPAPARGPVLESLVHAQPALHERVQRLLAASEQPTGAVRLPSSFEASVAAATSLQAGQAVGPYTLVRELGRGGMAVVWLARRSDGLLQRDVALKLPRFLASTAVERARFARERDVLAGLDHPRIACVHDAGVSEAGQPYIVLEYVDGTPITRDAEARRLSTTDRIALLLQVLAAVDHAHRHLVVHRDLKPSNILVDAQGRVKLLDFGIAKLLDEGPGGVPREALTQEAGCAVTARYAAPEQVDGGAITTATDVYALGVVAWELLTGHMPYGTADTTIAGWVAAVVGDEPRPSGLPADLDTVLRQALRKDPAQRYASAQAFADDLRRVVDHRPILARRPGLWRRTALFARRHRAGSGIAAMGLVAAVALAGTAWQQHRQTLAQRERADAVRDFMFDLVEGAGDDEDHPGVVPTGRQMIESAVRRAQSGFAAQPRLRGELLTELAIMRQRLGDAEGADALLQEGSALLQSNAPDDDPALNKNRAQRAVLRFERGQADAADALAVTVLAACREGRDCAKARSYAHGVRALAAHRAGRALDAESQARDRVRACEAAFGVDDAETALAWGSLAVLAREAGDLSTALDAADRAVAIGGSRIRSRASRVEVFRNRALLSLDLGDFADAQARLRALLPETRDPSEQALQWRLLATAALAEGRVAAGREAAESALRLASADDGDPERWFAHQAHARALSIAGDAAAAREELDAVVAGLLAIGYPGESMEVLRARRFRAEVDLRAGAVEPARDALVTLAARQAQAGAGQALELAQTQDLVGSAWRALGRADEAAAWHRRALASFDAKQLPANHPWRARNALYLSMAAWQAEPTPERRDALVRLATAYAARFPVDSIWRGRLAVDRVEAGCATAAACLVVL